MNRIQKIILVIVVLGAGVYGFRQEIGNLIKFHSLSAPCGKPIAYSLGNFGAKFGISQKSFLSAIAEAEAVWEGPVGLDLFAYADGGALKVNLIYDYRQQATSKLSSLGIAVDESRASYDALKIKYNTLNNTYDQAKVDYDAKRVSFEERKASYDQEVDRWNKKGGAPEKDYNQLQAEKTALQTDLVEIKQIETKISGYVDEINAMVVVLNRLAGALNLNVAKYNEIGAARGEEFTEGDYQVNGGAQEINIYEFSTYYKLVRILAHELGHALGLDHVADPKAIMYKLNISSNGKLAADDLSALKERCAI